MAPDPSKNLRALPERKRRVGMLSQGEVDVAQAHAEVCVIMKRHVNKIYMGCKPMRPNSSKTLLMVQYMPRFRNVKVVFWFVGSARPGGCPGGGPLAVTRPTGSGAAKTMPSGGGRRTGSEDGRT